ncbi:glycan-binding surface protein [Mucilaginibacter sp. RCC_168]|uniref:glycan-binding surface protein n=1 Tax=Mucilaginibacter sp. RCC_168 TaxID=3239221 RepID=UPI0035251386
MKKLNHHIKSYLLLALLATSAFIQSGCKKDSSSSSKGNPVITAIRNYIAHPGDSLLSSAGTGQWIVISGKNLKGALAINFDGVKGSFNDAWFSDTSAIALIPAIIAFPSVPSDKLNTIQYITNHGQTTFSFPIVAPAPTISGISNEDANPGDSIKINGLSFFFIKSVVYGGVDITSYKASNDGTSISMAVPAGLTNGGPVMVTTKSGADTTAFNVHDFVTGVFCNWDNINTYPWGSDTHSSSADFPGNNGSYNVLTATNLAGNDFAWYNGGRGVNMGAGQWVPTANVGASLDSYAVKFEISIPKTTPWVNGSIYVSVNASFNYIALYAPWKSAGGTTPFTTTGWQTVTIPLSSFRTNNGTGTQVASIKDLLGASGKAGMNIWYINDGSTPVTAFKMAIDNIRVVKIK